MPQELEPSRKEIFKLFDKISPTYDRVNRILSCGIDQSWRRKLTKHLPKQMGIHLLDLATGTGEQLFTILEECEQIVEAVGSDLSQEMLAFAKKKIEEKPYRYKVKFLQEDALSIPYPSHSFECVTISFGIRNVENVPACLSEIFRLLKKGGRVLILEMSLPPKGLLRSFYLFYLRHLLPTIGGLLSKNRKAYRYLNQTIETFPYGESFCTLLKEAGFVNVQAFPLTLGVVTLYQADRI